MPVYPTSKHGKDGQKKWRLVEHVEGTRHETTYTGKWADAKRRCAEWRRELEAGAASPRASREAVDLQTFCVETYRPHAKAHLATSTWDVRRFQLENVCRHLGALRLTEIITEAVEQYKGARTHEGAKPGTVNTELAKLQAVLTYARDVGEPCAIPKVRLLPERGRGRVKAWTKEQARALLATCEASFPDLFPLVLFLALTGCRKGEALACETSWIDLAGATLRIEPNAEWQPKDSEPREVPIEPALRPWLARAKDTGRRYVFAPTKRKKAGKLRERWAFFPRRDFDAAVKAAGLTGSPHKLRHTYASIFLAAGGSMFALSRILGHASIRTTERCYSHMLPEALDAARGRVDLGPAVGPARLEARERWAQK